MSDILHSALQRQEHAHQQAISLLGYDPREDRDPPRLPASDRDKRSARHLAVMLLRERDGSRCYLCKRDLDVDQSCIEHIIPISHGGENEPRNVAISCMACNTRKHDRAVAMDVSSGAPAYHVIR